MGLFDKIFGKKNEGAVMKGTGFQLLNAYNPYWLPFGNNVYESELVRASIDARARHISKLSIELQGTARPKLQNLLKHGPNAWQTWGQFLYRASTILDVNNTCIIVPVIDEYGDTTGVYPILPTLCKIVEYSGTQYLYVQFTNGNTAAIELARVGILTKHQFKNDFFGESNTALLPTMDLINIQNQGIQEGIKTAASYRFYAQYSNFTNADDLRKESVRFSEKNLKDGGGILLFPNTYQNIKQADSKPYVPDADTMKTIQTRVFNYFGVNEDILQSKAYGDAWSAFYESAIEPFAIQLSDVLTKMLFTTNERSFGARVFASANRLQYMTTSEKANVSALMADRGIMNRDEIREIWNLPPLPNGEGQAYIIRGEYYDAAEKITEENDGN